MSDTLLDEAEAARILGGQVEDLEVSSDEIDVALVLRGLRHQLAEAAESEHVGVNELARRLDVSPSAVSRMTRSDGDMRVSTLVLWAKALGREWDVRLRDRSDGTRHHNNGYDQLSSVREAAVGPMSLSPIRRIAQDGRPKPAQAVAVAVLP